MVEFVERYGLMDEVFKDLMKLTEASNKDEDDLVKDFELNFEALHNRFIISGDNIGPSNYCCKTMESIVKNRTHVQHSTLKRSSKVCFANNTVRSLNDKVRLGGHTAEKIFKRRMEGNSIRLRHADTKEKCMSFMTE